MLRYLIFNFWVPFPCLQAGADSFFLPTKVFWDSSVCRPAKDQLVVQSAVVLVCRVPRKAILPCDVYMIAFHVMLFKKLEIEFMETLKKYLIEFMESRL